MGEPSFLTLEGTYRLCFCRRQDSSAWEVLGGVPRWDWELCPGSISVTKQPYDLGLSPPWVSVSLSKDGATYSHPDCPSLEAQ